jgi:hypothetical protein
MSNNKMTTDRLIEGLRGIERLYEKEIVMIEFEDGSGNNFNYRLIGENHNRFIDYRTIIDMLGYDPANLLTSISPNPQTLGQMLNEANELDCYNEADYYNGETYPE